MDYTEERPLRVFEAFAGYGSQSLALKRLKEHYPQFDYVAVGFSEIEKSAIIAYQALHGDVKNYGDICTIDWEQVPDFDLFTYSFPCGLAGTKVKTIGGYRNIEDIQVGDQVLTHKNRYRSVTSTMSRNAPSYYEIHGTGFYLNLTSEHPLLVLRDGSIQWVKVKDLLMSDLVSICIPQKVVDREDIDDDILWLLGRYVADGWVNQRLYHSVEFGIGNNKAEEFESHIPSSWGVKISEKSCFEYRIANPVFQKMCLEFGSGAKNKRIAQWVIDLPKDRLLTFLDGYFSGDGHVRYRGDTKMQMFSTVSKELALGIQLCLLKTYRKVCSIYIRKDERKESFNDTYNGQISFCESNTQKIIEDKAFVPILSINEIKGSIRVYNISVADDESYTCENVNTHNCQDISAAGQQKGLKKGEGTRSGLLWECEKAIRIKRPKYLMLENVKALLSKKFINDYKDWVSLLASYGYETFTEIINSKNMGVPQNRERVFGISILKTEEDPAPKFNFPKPFKLELRLKDVLEEKVDEKYYLSDKMLECFRKTEDDGGGEKPSCNS